MTNDQFTKLFRLASYTNERLNSFEARLDTLEENKADKSDIDRVIGAIDGIYDRIDVLTTELVSVTSHQRRIQSQLNQHDKRIIKLEQA